MTISAVGYVVAVAIVVGAAYYATRLEPRRRGAVLAAALVVAVAIGWLSWLAGTSA